MNNDVYIVIPGISKDIYSGSIVYTGEAIGRTLEHLLGFYDDFDYSRVILPELADYMPADSIKLYFNFYYFNDNSIPILFDKLTINKINSDKNSYCWIFSPHEIMQPLNAAELIRESGLAVEKVIYTTSSFEHNNKIHNGIKCVNCPEWFEAQYRYNMTAFKDVSFIAPDKKYDTLPNATKKMLSLNRNIKGHRPWWYTELQNTQLLKDSHVSYHVPSIAKLEGYTDTEFAEWAKRELQSLHRYYTGNELRVDTLNSCVFNDARLDELDAHYIINYTQSIQEYYHDSLFSIVTESFYRRMFLTEKTFKAITHCHPFIIIGDDTMNTELKNRGYKTYDTMFNATSLMPFINSTEIIKYLENLSIDEIRTRVDEHWHIVEHNWHHFFTRKISWNSVQNNIMKIIK